MNERIKMFANTVNYKKNSRQAPLLSFLRKDS
jgi:hypothetical protein